DAAGDQAERRSTRGDRVEVPVIAGDSDDEAYGRVDRALGELGAAQRGLDRACKQGADLDDAVGRGVQAAELAVLTKPARGNVDRGHDLFDSGPGRGERSRPGDDDPERAPECAAFGDAEDGGRHTRRSLR